MLNILEKLQQDLLLYQDIFVISSIITALQTITIMLI